MQYKSVRNNKFVRLPNSGGESWIVIPSLPSWVHYHSTGPSFDALWACVQLSVSSHVHIVPNVLPRSHKVNLLKFRLNTKTYTILIECVPILPAPETISEERPWIEVVPSLLTCFDRCCHLYILCLLHHLFLAADSPKLFSSPQRAHVTFFVKRNKLELAFWLLCSVHAVIQVPPDRVYLEDIRNCCCHSFAACTVDVTVCFIRQTVSALTSGLSRYSAQPTPCW